MSDRSRAWAALWIFAACSCAPNPDGDGGFLTPDASVALDGGTNDDASVALDAGVGADASVGIEAGLVFGGICDDEPAGFPPRPLWSDIPATPDYQEVSNDLNAADTVRLLASMMEKATSKLQDLQSNITLEESKGTCVCEASPFPPISPSCVSVLQQDDKTKAECTTLCADLTSDPDATSCNLTGSKLTWVPTEIFKDKSNAARFGLRQVDFLDEVTDFLQSPGFSNTVGTFSSVSEWLENLADIMSLILDYVDRFTEGYHLGAYSEQRPDLHMCVGWAGHGAYAQMGNLGNGRFSIGSGYTSHNLSDKHRAQFRSGGFSAVAFDKPLSLLPGVEATLQMDGFRLWDVSKPFGISLGNGSISLGAIDDVDIFNLVDSTQASALDTTPAPSGDGQIQAGELLITGYTPFAYQRAPYPDTYEWPRAGVDAPWEGQSTAVFGLGLNLQLNTKPLEKTLPPIPIAPGATIIPYFKLKAGVGWMNAANHLRGTIQDKVNENIPPALHLSAADFARDMHDMQAPDVTGDNGNSAFVRPELGADLLLGLQLAKFLRMGVFARLGAGAHVEPKGYGGIVDMNHALADAMNHSNPPPEEPCDAIWEQEQSLTCSNELYDESTGSYACERDQAEGSCCIRIGDKRLCLDAYTGITEDVCTAQVKAADYLEKIKKYISASLYDGLRSVVNNATVQASWNATQTCAESDCNPTVPLPDIVSLSACEQRGFCVFRTGEVETVVHDVTREECENGLHVQRCVAEYVENPLMLNEVVGVAGNGELALWPWVGDYVPTAISEDISGPGFSVLGHRDAELAKAQSYADDHTDQAACEADGWCYGFVRAPGVAVDGPDTVYVSSFMGTAPDADSCPFSVDSVGNILDGDGQEIPRQYVPFVWQEVSFLGVSGVFTPYQCVSNITPTITGWEGPGCHPLTSGFPSACGCHDDSDCVSGETCEEGQCTDGNGSSCACDPDGPNTCAAGRVCDDGACMKPCSVDTDCPAYQVCDAGLCEPLHGIQTSEQITWGMQNVDAPMHSINTYALSEIEAAAYVTAGVRLELFLKIFRKTKKFTLWDWKDFWEIASLNKVWYQPGLQADYQHDCQSTVGGVTNHQPAVGYVDRYPDPTVDAAYDETQELLDWCKPELEANVADPDAPSTSDIGDSVSAVIDWGTDIGLEVWNAGQLCINGQLWSEYLSNSGGTLENAGCTYNDPQTGLSHSFPCRDLQQNLLNIWGCLDASRTTLSSSLAQYFNGGSGFDALTTYNGTTVFDLSALLVDPTGELEPGNVKPTFLAHNGNEGLQWLAEVEQCFNSRYDPESACACSVASDCNVAAGQQCVNGACVESTGERAACPVVTLDVTAKPCCGDGRRQAHEQCDDGNTDSGDGCAWDCQKEPRRVGCCCHAAGMDTTSENECDALGGSYAGDGSVCSDAICHGT